MCNFVVEMRKLIFFFAICVLFPLQLNAQRDTASDYIFSKSNPLHEIRAVWLATIGGIDWPHSYPQPHSGIEIQQKELCAILDKLVKAGINTVLLQTRVRGTMIYPSPYEPWDGCLSGKPGESPGYDALEFAIKECHKRGIKIHAWIVTIPIGKWTEIGCYNLRNKYPALVKKIGEEGFLNPEKEGVAEYLTSICTDIVTRYDVDGIHLDYIRYPETWGKITDKNKARNNITKIVKKISKSVKAVKPWIVMSCSPVGKYADTKRTWARGWTAKDAVCQDAASWLKYGYMDILFPMMYFKNDNFYPFLIDWKERSNEKIVVPGLGIYFMHPDEKNWHLNDITKEMMVSRQYDMGVCLFRSKFFTDNTKGLYDYTKDLYSPTLSLQPALTWLNNSNTPYPPQNVSLNKSNGFYTLKWDTPIHDTSSNGGLLFNIYGDSISNIDTNNSNNLIAANYSSTTLEIPTNNQFKYFAIKSTDRYGNESVPIFTDKHLNEESIKKQQLCSISQFIHDNKYVYINSKDICANEIVEIQNTIGITMDSRFIRKSGNKFIVDISNISIGHYKVYLINKKGYRHLLGTFSVEP